jgi:hypothetical protein
MKKISLGVAALLFTGLAFAQSGANDLNVSDVVQIGPNNSGSIIQTSVGARVNYMDLNQDTTQYPMGVAGSNNADITQNGGNDAFLTQAGSENDLSLNQSGGLVMYNEVTIDQRGVNIAEIDQAGDAQTIDLEQESIFNMDANYAQVLQGQVDPTSIGNSVEVRQFNSSNFTRIIQNGSNNTSSSLQISDMSVPVGITGYLQGSHITQTGVDNFADSSQQGANQISRITQTALTGNPSGGMAATNIVINLQVGNFNSSIINQNDSGSGPDASNQVNTLQINNQTFGGNLSEISQSGQNNHNVLQAVNN